MKEWMNETNIDPRIAAAFRDLKKTHEPKFKTREELLVWANSEEAVAMQEMGRKDLDKHDTEEIAPSEGLDISTKTITSEPDGNTIHILFIRPESAETLPCVYYIHGGGMKELSCYYGNYRAWGRLLARQKVAVAMVDFRNAMIPSSVPEVAPFPAGLNDCISGIKWISANSESLGIDPDQIIVSGESGGGNLTLTVGMKLKQDGDLGLIQGLYALCPSVGGANSMDEDPTSIRNPEKTYPAGILAYGLAEYENRNPLAWPGFATAEDVCGLPPTVISINEFDQNEGTIQFFRLLLSQGVPATCRQLMGTSHAIEVMPTICPEIARETARSIADFCKGRTRPGRSE